jgi:aspartate carbamoyltransferase catalytic subunit
LARYAPEEVDKDSKKHDMFKKGLTPELRTLLTRQIYPDFNTLMNMTILTERAKEEEKKENKRKFMENKAQQQERSQRKRSFGHPIPGSKPPCSTEPSHKPRALKAPEPSSNPTTIRTP